MSEATLANRRPETGAFFQRDRNWHPPAYTPGYKTSVLRSPQKALLSLDNTLSEITGPVFGHSLLGEADDDLIHNFAKPGESAIALLDMEATIPMDARAYKFDIVLRGRRASMFENGMEGN